MNTDILTQYRQYLQSQKLELLFDLAQKCCLLNDGEIRSGKLDSIRQTQIKQRLEKALGLPQSKTAYAYYGLLSDEGIQPVLYEAGLSDREVTNYCYLISRLWWHGSSRLTDTQQEVISIAEGHAATSGYICLDFEDFTERAAQSVLDELTKQYEVAA